MSPILHSLRTLFSEDLYTEHSQFLSHTLLADNSSSSPEDLSPYYSPQLCDTPMQSPSSLPCLSASISYSSGGQWKEEERLGVTMYGVINSKKFYDGHGYPTSVRAVKKIKKNPYIDTSDVYEQEKQSAARFSSLQCWEYFVQPLGCYNDSEHLCIEMEYSIYGTLEQCITPPIQELDAQSIAWQVLKGLQFLHATDTAHLNLRPSNILVMSRGPYWQIKIGDFGLIDKPELAPSSFDLLTSATGYLAPEILGLVSYKDQTGDPRSTASDIWALGEILHRALTGAQTFTKSTLLAFTSCKILYPRKALLQNGIGLSGWHFLNQLMSPQPADRPTPQAAMNHSWIRHFHLMEGMTY